MPRASLSRENEGTQMRIFVVTGSLSLAAIACGASTHPGQTTGIGGKCPSEVVAGWTGITRFDHLAIASDDTFAYEGVDGCASHGTVRCSDPNTPSGTIYVSVEASTGGSCLAAGEYACSYGVSGNTFQYDCGGMGTLQYRK